MVSFCCQVLTKPLKDYAAKARSSNAYELSFAFICFELIVGRILPETPQCFPSQSMLFYPRLGLHKPPYMVEVGRTARPSCPCIIIASTLQFNYTGKLFVCQYTPKPLF